MKILLASLEFETLTGQPIYNYNLARGLVELGHEVVCVGMRKGGTIEEWLDDIWVDVYSFNEIGWRGEYDIAIISENYPCFIDHIKCDKIYNFCHSKGELDRPIEDERITGYLFPREQVRDYWKKEGQIIPIPINFERFKEKKKQDKYTILAPCTLDPLRKPMILNLLKRANDKTQVWIVGKDYGALRGVKLPKNVTIFGETEHVEDYMDKADEVAGIFVGTVTIEAWVAGCKTSVYDEQGNWEYVEKPKDLKKHDYKEIAKQIINL